MPVDARTLRFLVPNAPVSWNETAQASPRKQRGVVFTLPMQPRELPGRRPRNARVRILYTVCATQVADPAIATEHTLCCHTPAEGKMLPERE